MSNGFVQQVRVLLPNLSFQDLTQKPWISTALLVILSYALLYTVEQIAVAFYYQHFHPLASFPGPKEASSSRHWVHRVLASGKAEETFAKLHAKYSQ